MSELQKITVSFTLVTPNETNTVLGEVREHLAPLRKLIVDSKVAIGEALPAEVDVPAEVVEEAVDYLEEWAHENCDSEPCPGNTRKYHEDTAKVGKAIDKAAGAEREVVGSVPPSAGGGFSTARGGWRRPWMEDDSARDKTREITAPATEDAARWDGWGTALKPAAEHWWLARRPLRGTVAATVLAHGTGALNIDGCRTSTSDDLNGGAYYGDHSRDTSRGWRMNDGAGEFQQPAGRWPTNVMFSHAPDCEIRDEGNGEIRIEGPCAEDCPVAELDRQSGVATYGDTGGASRYFPIFRYEAKAPKSERPRLPDGTAHATVKPLALLRFLVRLVTPPGGLVLDPFAGSGTTGEACVIEGFRSLLIEQDPAHAELIRARLAKPIQPTLEAS